MVAAAQQPRGFRDGRVIYMGNDAVYGQGVRDRQPDGRPVPDSQQAREQQFEGLSPEARYELDTFGFLHLHGVLSPTELASARAAFDRTQHDSSLLTPYGELPFAADADLEALYAGSRERR